MLERERLRLCDRSFDRPSSLVSVERARTRLEGRWKEEGLKAGTSARSASAPGYHRSGDISDNLVDPWQLCPSQPFFDT